MDAEPLAGRAVSRRAFLRTGVLLLALGVLTLVAAVVCGLLAIWSGDSRWGDTAFLAFIVGAATIGAGACCLVGGSS